MKTIDFSYFIERYIAGEMSETEKLWFQKEIDGNPELKKEVELRRKTEDVLKRGDIITLREKLVNIENQVIPGKSQLTPWRGILKYAAVLAGVAVIAGGLLLVPKQRLSNDEIMEKYYAPYEPSSSSRSGVVAVNPDYNQAVEYYKIKDYSEAAIYFRKVLASEPKNMSSWLLNGISNFEISNYPEAKTSFKTVIEDNKNLYVDHAQWYLALCYLKTGDAIKAKELLMLIKDSENPHNKDAGKILKNLK